MLEYFRFVFRNPSYITKNARGQSIVRKAMLKYRKEHPHCEHCGRTKHIDVHHIKPVSTNPELAADPTNFMMLCRKPPCHQIIGHAGYFAGSFVINAKTIGKWFRVVKVKGTKK